MTTAKFKIESGVQFLARVIKKTEILNFYPIIFEHGLKHGETVEISSNCNTSYLLIDMICEALLPSKPNEEPTGILIFNTAGHFIYDQLIIMLQKRIYSNLDFNLNMEIRNTEMERLLHQALSKLFLLEIYDATQFYATIHNLDNLIMKHPSISLIIFDTLTAFYWSEQGFKITKMDLYIKNVLRVIKNVSREYNVIFVYTKPEYFSSSKDADNLEISEDTDGINLKIQLIDISKGVYQVNIKTLDSYNVKYFNLIDNLIKWQ